MGNYTSCLNGQAGNPEIDTPQTEHCAPARASAHNLGLWPHILGWLGVSIYAHKKTIKRTVFLISSIIF
jgi:hypothetical protein